MNTQNAANSLERRIRPLAAAVFTAGAFYCQAAVYNVNSVATLVSAINSANASGNADTINLAPGIYNLTNELPIIAANKTILFQGATANPADTALRQTAAGKPILETYYDGTTNEAINDVLTFNDLAFENGQSGPDGGGALLVGGIGCVTTVSNCFFGGNSAMHAFFGGALENVPDGFLNVYGSRFENNSAANWGGAISFSHVADAGSVGGLPTSSGSAAATPRQPRLWPGCHSLTPVQ